MTNNSGYSYLLKYSEKITKTFDKYMESEVKKVEKVGSVPAEIFRKFHQIARKGKKLRGALVALGYEIAGGKVSKDIIEASICIEIAHAAILIHDDIMDQDLLRRGLRTIHHQNSDIAKFLNLKINPDHYGVSTAICIADAGFYLSWQKLLKTHLPDKYKTAAGEVYSHYYPYVAYGQILDLTNIELTSMSEKNILHIYQHKTVDYTGTLPLLFGAALGGLKNKKKIRALKEYGQALGWAFQIQDDILGMFGTEEETGKPVISDLREGKNTLLMLHLSQHGTPEQLLFMHQVLGNPKVTEKQAEKMRQMLKDAGSYQYVIDLGWKYVGNAKKAVPELTNDPKLAKTLSSLVEFMMERTL